MTHSCAFDAGVFNPEIFSFDPLKAALSTVSTLMGDSYKRVNHTKGCVAGVVSHREELIQYLTPHEGRVRH
jgi:hypothetical protein